MKQTQSKAETTDGETIDVDYIHRKLFRLANGDSGLRAAQAIVLLNFIFLFSRIPTTISILATLQITILLAVLCLLLMLPRINSLLSFQVKGVIGFLCYNAFMIFLGKVIVDDLITNDGAAFATWKSLTWDTFTCFLPVMAYSLFGKGLRRLRVVLIFVGCYLSLYGITHGGKGPGGFVNDENDLCFVLIMVFPFAALSALEYKSIFSRLMFIGASLFLLAGVVASMSRGGFLGLVFTITYLFWRSPNKAALIFGGIFCGLIALPFVPKEYWDEMSTIKTETQSRQGTAEERLESWAIGLRMFSDPKYTIQGVGIGNGPWKINDYEPSERGITIKSLAGRQFHSMHVQMLTDLGLIGLIFTGVMLWATVQRNNRYSHIFSRLARANRKLYNFTLQALRNDLPISPSAASDRIEFNDQLSRCRLVEQELESWKLLMLQINISLVSILITGSFISVYYYPPLWFLLICSGCLQSKAKELVQLANWHLEKALLPPEQERV